MQFSVLIVARNASKIIVPLLEDLKICDDVIVVNVRSTVDTLEKFHKFKNIKVFNSVELIKNHKKEDVPFLNNVILNSMRYHFHTSKIIKKYIKKKLRDNERILIIGGTGALGGTLAKRYYHNNDI